MHQALQETRDQWLDEVKLTATDTLQKVKYKAEKLGQFNAEDDSVINLRNASHMITDMWWEDNDVMGKIGGFIPEPDVFYSDVNRLVWEAMTTMRRNGEGVIDVVTILSKFKPNDNKKVGIIELENISKELENKKILWKASQILQKCSCCMPY